MFVSERANWMGVPDDGSSKLGARKPVAMRAYRLTSESIAYVPLTSQLTRRALADS